MNKFNHLNPRFVLVVGAIREVYDDIPDSIGDDGAVVLWDRQEQKPVVTIHSEYANAICLEHNTSIEAQPFSNIEDWFNGVSNRALTSENIPATK